eukprot:gene4764-5963_t
MRASDSGTSRPKKMGKSWNNDVSLPSEARRMNQMAEDIRHFILRAHMDPVEKQKMIEQSQRDRRLAQDTYDKIFATFGFRHCEGTDKVSELRVVKIIMVRESLLG